MNERSKILGILLLGNYAHDVITVKAERWMNDCAFNSNLSVRVEL